MTIGLTGGYCAGKSSAAAMLREAGWAIVDVDALGHRALELSAGAVVDLLGEGVRKPDGSLDRRAIGAIVFADPDALARYEKIVHPAMNALVQEAVAASGDRVCVDAAILYRLPIVGACDAIIEIRAPLWVRVRRAKKRDGLGTGAIIDRIARQRPLWAAGRAYTAKTIVVMNGGDQDSFQRDINRALFSICAPRAIN